MKRTFYIVVLIMIVCVLYGCENTDKNSKETKTDFNFSNVSGFSLDSYNIETDDQVFFDDNHSMVSCKEGYYYFIGEVLYFFDRNSKQSVPVCSKPDCSHTSNDLDCNAYFAVEQYYTSLGIYYYNSNLYLLANDGTDNTKSLYLYKISKDGSSREQVCHIEDFGSDIGSMQIHFVVQKGTGYLSYTVENKAEIYSFNIEEKNPTLNKIDEISGAGAEIYRLHGCDNGISYQYGSFTDENLEVFEGGIKIYINGNSQTVAKNAVKPYVIANGNVYYETADSIKNYSLKSGDTSKFKTVSEAYSLNYDGKYFYAYDCMADEQTVYVYDDEQKNIGKFDTPSGADSVFFIFGDTDLFFCECLDENNNGILYYLDKSQIGTGKYEWKTVFSVSDTGEVILNE